MEKIYYIVLVPMVYISFAMFIFGIIFQVIRLFFKAKSAVPAPIFFGKNPKPFAAWYDTFLLPTVRKHNPILWLFLMIFHICFLLLIIGHIELIADISIIQIIPHTIFLGNGYIGFLMAISLLFFLFRRFFTPYRQLSIPEDYFLLILLFLTVIFGSEMDWARNLYGYGQLGIEDYRTYLSSMIFFKPELTDNILDSGHSFMLVLHVFFANVFLMIAPFSKIIHFIIALPVNKLRRGIHG
ncbi:MAG: respiratory nitrate reductase subunit gamma [Desulfobacterales bacterium]|nr:respiratory nitrate reductase subunit gamma [Desulfobacterales bacterium]